MTTEPTTSKKEVLHPEETITSFLLIRHGDTNATERGLLYNDPGAELTEKGWRQAQAVADWIAQKKPDVVLCGTAKRVLDTAETITKRIELDAVKCEGISEWQVGEWEGRTYLDIKRNDPKAYSAWSQDPIRNRPPGGESIAELYERVNKQVEDLIAKHAGKTVALVTHAGVIRSILVSALGMPIDNFWRISIPVGTISRVDFSANFATIHFVSLKP
jgi:broad specificity phosphatase PhoE